MEHSLDSRSTSVLKLTRDEAAILDAAAEIKFGELLEVGVEHGEQEILRVLHPEQLKFIHTLREEGLTHLHHIIVHNGFPSQIEVLGTFGSIQYRRKIRFN
jgi:hypothetical protein